MKKLNQTILLRIEPETKVELQKIAQKEHYSMTGLILSLIDARIEQENDENQTNI